MATVPNTETFSLDDVVDVVNPTTDDLDDCFSDAVAAKFDRRYEGDKDRLSNFRNYGYSKSIGSEVDTQEVLTGSYYDNCWLKADPDNNWIYVLRGYDNTSYTVDMIICSSSGIFSPSGYTLSLSVTTPTDWLVVDQYHIYITDKYTNGGSYYFRLRWCEYDINTPGFTLIDTVTNSVNSTVYADKSPKVTATDDYVYIANWASNTSVHYIYRFSVGTSSLGTITSTLDISYEAQSLYIENNVLYLSTKESTSTYLYSYEINTSNGSLSLIDNLSVLTNPSNTLLTLSLIGNNNTCLYYISKATDEQGYISHDGDGDNLSLENSNGVNNVLGLDYSHISGCPVINSTANLIILYHDSNDDVKTSDSTKAYEDVAGGSTEEEFVLYENGCCAMSQHNHIIVAGFYNATFNPNDSVYLFSYPVT